MNERIRELAEQAGLVKILEEHAHEYGAGTFENTPYPELEKFAELIVGECLTLADSIRDECDKDGESQQALGAAWVGIAIARHFGVEE